MKSGFVIGSRGSELALKQSESVRRAFARLYPKFRFTIQVIKTKGDRDKSLSVFDHKDTGVFTRAIEESLLRREVDFAVHSLKDLPTALPRGLRIGACLKREDPRDALVTKNGAPLERLKRGATVGTASPRRARQIAISRPDLRISPLRGNLDTRITRVLKGDLDAIVIARAGLIRLGRHARFAKTISFRRMLPCVGQGILAVEIRSNDAATLAIADKLNHKPSAIAAVAERSFLAALRGGCQVPVGAIAIVRGARLTLDTVVLSVRGPQHLRGKLSGRASDAARIGKTLAKTLLKQGAGRLLDEARGR